MNKEMNILMAIAKWVSIVCFILGMALHIAFATGIIWISDKSGNKIENSIHETMMPFMFIILGIPGIMIQYMEVKRNGKKTAEKRLLHKKRA